MPLPCRWNDMEAAWVHFFCGELCLVVPGCRGLYAAGARRAPSCYVPVCRRPGTDRRSPMTEYVPDGVFARSREALARAEQWLAGAEAAGAGLAGLEGELQVRGREI